MNLKIYKHLGGTIKPWQEHNSLITNNRCLAHTTPLLIKHELLFTILYADDTCVLLSVKDLTKLIIVINADLKSLSAWFRSNKLTVNTQKTFRDFLSI